MRVTLEVRTGPRAGNKIRLKPGELARVGRSARADFAFPDDSHMSGVHFLIECDELACRIRDLNSRNGTLVNGRKVGATTLARGDMIVAGETSLFVRIESEQVEASPAAADLQQGAPGLEGRLLALLREQLQPLHAVLDAARDIKILVLLLQSQAEYQSLYEGPQGDALAQFAPYLVRLPKESPLLETLVREGWGKGWGVYLTCEKEFKEVRRHLRHFLEVKLADGREVYFRYYDPRVLRLFLPTCTPQEIDQFFGPVKYYLMEDEKPDTLLHFTNTRRGAEKKVLPLSVPEPEPAAG